MIEESTEYYQVEEKFLIVLDSAIPSQIGNFREPFSVENPTINSLTNKSDLIFNLQYPIEKSMEDIQLKCSVKSATLPVILPSSSASSAAPTVALLLSPRRHANIETFTSHA